jgi:hypothetical protein
MLQLLTAECIYGSDSNSLTALDRQVNRTDVFISMEGERKLLHTLDFFFYSVITMFYVLELDDIPTC